MYYVLTGKTVIYMIVCFICWHFCI